MTWEYWADQKVVPVIVVNDPFRAVDLGHALIAAGIFKLEVTLRTERAVECIAAIASQVPKAQVGAGTVLDNENIKAATAAGATFLVSPGATPRLISDLQKNGLPFLPGAATVSEVLALREQGIDSVKFFPAVESGGLGWLKAISTVVPSVHFCPTGGIGPSNYQDFLNLPNVMCVGGSWIAPAVLIEKGEWAEITRLAKSV